MKYKNGEAIPETFEEYVSIHGEPEYEDSYKEEYPIRFKIIDHDKSTDTDIEEIKERYSEYVWTDKGGGLHVNYNVLARRMILTENLICYKGMFYNPFREVSAESLRQLITQLLIDKGWTGKMDSVCSSCINTMRDLANVDDFSGSENFIYFQNGELDISSDKEWIFYADKFTHTPYRLNCDFVSEALEMPMFTKWVTDVFEKEDIDTIQELLGYCMIPTNKVQEAFILVGSAGVGKSVLGYLLHDIFGNGYVALNVTELDENKFILANIENKLIVYDDDLQTRALTDTGVFKKLITSEQPIKAERKGQQPYMFTPHATVICNTNVMIQSLYDDSEGFFRRLHPICVKEKKPGRRNIVDMNIKVCLEKNGIIRWALQGLWNLRRKHFQIHWSDRSREFLEAEKNPFKAFFDDVFEVTGSEEDKLRSQDIIKIYNTWCRKNGVGHLGERRLLNWFSKNQSKLNITYKKIGKEKLSGYVGLKLNEIWKKYLNY